MKRLIIFLALLFTSCSSKGKDMFYDPKDPIEWKGKDPYRLTDAIIDRFVKTGKFRKEKCRSNVLQHPVSCARYIGIEKDSVVVRFIIDEMRDAFLMPAEGMLRDPNAFAFSATWGVGVDGSTFGIFYDTDSVSHPEDSRWLTIAVNSDETWRQLKTGRNRD